MGIAGDFTLIVLAGLGGAVVARVLGLPLLVGYVAAGVVVGPHTAGPTIANFEDIELLAEIGVALLLFALGLELSFRDLHAVRRIALIGGPIQIVLTAAVGALVTRAATGMALTDALWFGAMLSLSSTMVVLKTLATTGTTSTLASRVMIGLLVVQDLAVVPLLIVLPQFSQMGVEGTGMRMARATLAATLFLLVVVTVGARVLPALLRRVVRWGSRELFLIAVVAAGVGVGYLAFRMGLSFAVGAFVAGLILSESELSHQALSDIGPLRDLFGLLFFVSVGMLFDPRFALEHAGDVTAIVLATIVGKSLICGLLARAFGYKNLAPWIVGIGLSQVGEFSFVLARVGQSGGFISDDTYNLALTCTVLSMALSPLVFPGLLPVVRAWARSRQGPASPTTTHAPPVALENHVIVAGYGRTGRAVVGALHGAGVPYVVVEMHHEALTALSEQGIPTVWGDIAGEDILRAAGVAQARMLVMAVPEWRAVRLGIEHATRMNARLFVVARATTTAHVDNLRQLRVDAIVQPEFEGGIEMVRRALTELDRKDEEIDRLSRDLRRALYGDEAEDDRADG
jgi:CPA2 family monovalent cation:H+ antiporter-2